MMSMLSFLRLMRWGLIYLGPRRDVTIDTANGRLTVSSKDWLHGKYLYVNRGFEINSIHETIALLRKEGYLDQTGKGVILDVGANLGMFCIPLVKQGYFQRAIAFEPAPETFRLLAHNISQNNLRERIDCFNYALSSVAGALELELSKDNSGDHRIRYNSNQGAFQEHSRRTIHVTALTLDQFFAENPEMKKDDVALIWLDIQGHEGHFFEGAKRSLHPGMAVISEFWPYAIARSGLSRSDYLRIVSKLFTHFYHSGAGYYDKRPIAEIDTLFDLYSGPKQMCTVILV
jgi:FkbM family methyltransferase